MPNRLFSPPRPHTRERRRGRRTAAWAGVLVASVTALGSAGTLAAASPASAATSAARAGAAPAGDPAPAHPQGKPRVTAAVLGLDDTGGQPKVYGDDTPYDTASIIKVDILATTLLQAQDAGRQLTAQERTRADAMIRRSDNASADALWRSIGRAPGLEAANKRLGLTSTKGGPGPKWGLTRTTASDQIRLLRAVFDTNAAARGGARALTGDSRSYVRILMARITSEQSWGVSAAARSGWALKNGWLQRNTTGLWDVNSVGRITVDGRRYVVAVLSEGNSSMSEGISRVERAARTAVASASGR
ncbi:serine hydrolase [Streptomyces sp. NPDC046197]|uniref:serine hydrolase n=1 Tax=Streptomyces sp. NPDC046197 TaxID=3154337 RepID=UPI0033FF7F79